MSDYDLLRDAARAVGLNVGTRDGAYDDLKWWNPIENDAQAFQLAVDLNLNVFHTNGCCYAMESDTDGSTEQVVAYRDCISIIGLNSTLPAVQAAARHSSRYAATRRAIVLVAAEIGKYL